MDRERTKRLVYELSGGEGGGLTHKPEACTQTKEARLAPSKYRVGNKGLGLYPHIASFGDCYHLAIFIE